MPHPAPYSFELWRIDLALCAGEFRIGRLSEAGFRHHLARLGYAGHEIEAEVEWHRQFHIPTLADALGALEAA